MMKYFMLLASVSMAVAASTLLKFGSRAVNFDGGLWEIIGSYLSSPVIIGGFAAYAIGAVLWVYCLAAFDLSYVSFVSSIQYVLLMLVSILVFNEQISFIKWVGCGFIMIGVFFWLKG